MAYENLELSNPNFCIAPVDGTFATLHDSSTLRIVNDTGTLQNDYTLTSSITNDLLCLEYVGPREITSVITGLTFFTIEKASSSSTIIKRWEIDYSGLTLDLKQTITKSTSGVNYFDGISGCVEFYERSFSGATASGSSYIDVNSSSRIEPGHKLYLGPSNDIDNLGEGEYVTVDYKSGNRVYLTTNTTKDYLQDDKVTFYNKIYIYSNLGYNGDSTKGTLFQLNAYSGSILGVNYDGFYKSISASKWYPTTGNIPSVVGTNMVFVSPYNSYLNWRSISLNNIESDKATTITVRDVAFKDNTIYKLMQKVTKKDDDGVETTENWSPYYNYQEDSILPYTNSIEMYTDKAIMVGQYDTTEFTIVVKDQFGVGLNAVDVSVARDGGDSGVVLDPLDGQVTTNSSGIAYVGYTSGASYHGATKLTCNAQGGSSSTGSAYVWDSIYIHSLIEHSNDGQVYAVSSGITVEVPTLMRQLDNTFNPDFSIFCKTYFTSPGGDWVNPSSYSSEVSTYLPHIFVGPNDGPQESFFGWSDKDNPGKNHTIRQVADFEGEGNVQQWGEVVDLYATTSGVTEFQATVSGAISVDYEYVWQMEDPEFDLQLSQLKLSLHTSWVDGVAYDELFTDTSINQFVFVDDAVPAFFSEKNPIDTDIWIRLRPYASDLDASTLKFYVREVSYEGDTGYVDMGSYLTVTTFPAGGGNDGLEITCDPPNDFHYNAVVYVRIEVYDTASTPNFIWLDYWFGITPDYRFPYLVNLDPSREEDNVAVDTDIYFEIKDVGVGVDISTLEMTVNSRIVIPTSIVKVDDKHYKVTYDPASNFQFGKSILVNVKVADASENANLLNDSYRFYTAVSDEVWYDDFYPGICKRGIPRYSSIRLVVLGGGSGVDQDSIRVQVLEKEATDRFNIVPIVYRIS